MRWKFSIHCNFVYKWSPIVLYVKLHHPSLASVLACGIFLYISVAGVVFVYSYTDTYTFILPCVSVSCWHNRNKHCVQAADTPPSLHILSYILYFFFCSILAMCIFINSFSSSLILCTLHLVYSMHYEHDPGYKRWIRMCMGWWARVVYFLNVALRAPHIAHATPRTISAPLKESIFLLLLFVVVVFCN